MDNPNIETRRGNEGAGPGPARNESLGEPRRVGFDVERSFTYHAPTAAQEESYRTVRTDAKQLANNILDVCPESRERSLALTALEESVMWANKAIAIHPVKEGRG